MFVTWAGLNLTSVFKQVILKLIIRVEYDGILTNLGKQMGSII